MYPALISFIIGIFILSQTHASIVLLIAGALIGFGYGTYMSSLKLLRSIAPAHRVGLATSTFFILTDIGLGIGPFLLGFLVPAIGYNGLYIVLAILLVICLPLHYLLNKRKSTAPTVITNS